MNTPLTPMSASTKVRAVLGEAFRQQQQRPTREIARRVRRHGYLDRGTSTRARVSGSIAARRPRDNPTRIVRTVREGARDCTLYLEINADVSQLGGSASTARREVLGWFSNI